MHSCLQNDEFSYVPNIKSVACELSLAQSLIENMSAPRIVAGNWKMNLNRDEAIALCQELISHSKSNLKSQLIICPAFPWLGILKPMLDGSGIALGAQNCSHETKGAYTGDVSAAMLQSLGVEYVILGHSERRSIFGETDEIVRMKLLQALAHDLKPILCIGETLQERENGLLEQVLRRQIESALQGLNKSQLQNLTLAYEPVWAIGTGLTASPEQARDAHKFVRSILLEHFPEDFARNIPILYGGSCNAANASGLFAQADIDGGLIGGASLKAGDFIQIGSSW